MTKAYFLKCFAVLLLIPFVAATLPSVILSNELAFEWKAFGAILAVMAIGWTIILLSYYREIE